MVCVILAVCKSSWKLGIRLWRATPNGVLVPEVTCEARSRLIPYNFEKIPSLEGAPNQQRNCNLDQTWMMASTSAVVPSAKWQVFPTIFVRRGRSVISFGHLNPIGLVLSAKSDLLQELQYVETLSVEAISSDILHSIVLILPQEWMPTCMSKRLTAPHIWDTEGQCLRQSRKIR